MLATFGTVAILAAQPSVQARSPYLDVVRLYAPGREREAIVTLRALRLEHPDQVFRELDDRLCRAVQVESCRPAAIRQLTADRYTQLVTAWRRLYPRALALHVAVLASCDPVTEHAAITVHRMTLIRLIGRVEEIGRLPYVPSTFADTATTGRHLLVWALQHLRDESGLASTLDLFAAARIDDADIRLARCALAELRTSPEAVTAAARHETLGGSFPRDTMLARIEARRLEIAVRVYEQLIADHPAVLEAHLRLARLELRRRRTEQAEAHLVRVAGLRPDARQAYLAALFLADVYERQRRTANAITAYGIAQQHWPDAQTPGIGLARLRALDGAYAEARAALRVIATPPAGASLDRSDPWLGYDAGQAWRLPAAIAALQATFEPMP
jgi:tetratricopeptide (TPR) repeat protein